MSTELTPRGAAVLEVVVRHFIATGQPVGSATVASDIQEAVSSATVRNAMADLERRGYLEQPHTSAGRQPTARGYIAYVEHLMEYGRLHSVDESSIRAGLDSVRLELDALLQRACSMLSEMTHQVGVVLTPLPAEFDIRHIDLVRMGADRVSVVFVTGGGMVHTRTIGLEEALDDGDLQAAADYLLRRFGGLTLRQLRECTESAEPESPSGSAALALRLVRRSLGDAINEASVLVEGTFHLLDTPDLAERATLPSILAAFEERTQLSRLLTECGATAGPSVLIGRAGLPEALRGCALVAASYHSGSRPLGALGILGPARMEYHRTIPMVDTMARVTSDMVTRLCA